MSDNDTAAMPPSPPTAPPPSTLALSSDERMWAMLGHLSAFTAFITGIGCILGPLVIWLIKRDTMAFAGEQAKEALNYNITVALTFVGLWVLTIITFGIGLFLTVPIGFLLFIAWMVFTIIAAIKANEGVDYRYPFTLRLVK
ncbi:MAG TPA: DUF4870 domain-containing protein [Dokdonella sp.]